MVERIHSRRVTGSDIAEYITVTRCFRGLDGLQRPRGVPISTFGAWAAGGAERRQAA